MSRYSYKPNCHDKWKITTADEWNPNNKWSTYENNQQHKLYRIIYYSKSALHVSGNVFRPSSGAFDCVYSI